MPIQRQTGNRHWLEYSTEEIEAAWDNQPGQGHDRAKARQAYCAVRKCTLKQAIYIAKHFTHNLFAIPTCTHFNGETISLYCGDAGSGADNLLKSTTYYLNSVLGVNYIDSALAPENVELRVTWDRKEYGSAIRIGSQWFKKMDDPFVTSVKCATPSHFLERN